MKILFPLGAFYPSQIGGPCNTLYWHTTALYEKGLEVTIVATSKGIGRNMVKQFSFEKKECGNIYYGGKSTLNIKTIVTALKEINKAQVLHLNSLFNPLSFVSFFYTRLFFPKIRIVWSIRGESHPSAMKFSRWKKRPLLFLYKHLCGNVLFHSTSQEETGYIKDIFNKSSIVFIPNLVQPSPHYYTPKKKKLLFMGRIHPIKALDKLLIALSMSSIFLSSDFVLDIVGSYEDRHQKYFDYLMQLIQEHGLEDKVIFSGHLIGEAKEKKYAESYFLILPSESENFGNVVIEAMNQGTPVIASKGTPWEILETYKAGFHTDNRPDQLANAINTALGLSRTDYLEYSGNALKLVNQEYNVNTQIHRWIDCYKNLYNDEE